MWIILANLEHREFREITRAWPALHYEESHRFHPFWQKNAKGTLLGEVVASYWGCHTA